jgi:ABC-type branched-subunit amino acid transport system substrate-binding protein
MIPAGGLNPRGKNIVSRSFRVGIVACVVLATAMLAGAPAGAQSSSKPTATDVGITATTIRIAVVADVDNPIVPGVLQGIVDGMNGFGKYINANGGLAGRKVQVDFIDSKLNPNEARNAVIKACAEDFALVGTAAIFLNTADDEVNCVDQAGKATGLPDMGAIDTNVPQACSPVSYPIVPASVECSTATQSPQTYRGNQGDSKYFLKKFGDLHGAFVVAGDTPATERTSKILGIIANKAGIKSDQNAVVGGRDPNSVYTPIIQNMKNSGSNYSLAAQAVNGVVAMRQEAQLQGLTDPKIIWQCTLACYEAPVFLDGGTAVNGEYMAMSFLPFDEGSTNKMTANFVKYTGKDKLSGFASWGFTAGLLFQQAAKAVVAKSGNNGLTRATLLAELKNIHDFNGSGMVATTDVGGRVPSPCFMLEQYKGNNKFVRTYPTKKGTFDCNKSNAVTFQQDLNG